MHGIAKSRLVALHRHYELSKYHDDILQTVRQSFILWQLSVSLARECAVRTQKGAETARINTMERRICTAFVQPWIQRHAIRADSEERLNLLYRVFTEWLRITAVGERQQVLAKLSAENNMRKDAEVQLARWFACY
jgi:hypothetical protein